MASCLPFFLTDEKIEKIKTMWPDMDLTIAEIAELSGVTYQWLQRNYTTLNLSSRGYPNQKTFEDPTPEEIRTRAMECRRKHFAKKKQESCPFAEERYSKAYTQYMLDNA